MDTVTAASASAEQHSATDAVGAAASSNADSMQNGSAGRRTVGIVYDKVMEYHVREGACVALQGSQLLSMPAAAGPAAGKFATQHLHTCSYMRLLLVCWTP